MLFNVFYLEEVLLCDNALFGRSVELLVFNRGLHLVNDNPQDAVLVEGKTNGKLVREVDALTLLLQQNKERALFKHDVLRVNPVPKLFQAAFNLIEKSLVLE